MTSARNLWAIGFDGIDDASRLRDEIIKLGWDKHYLVLEGVAMVARHSDGSFSLDREKFPVTANVLGCTSVGFIAGLVIGGPLLGAAVGALVGGIGSVSAAVVGIDDQFVEQVKRLMKPGTCALFVLDSDGDMDEILHAIRGLGGTVLKTNVDLKRAQLIQSTLATTADRRSAG